MSLIRCSHSIHLLCGKSEGRQDCFSSTTRYSDSLGLTQNVLWLTALSDGNKLQIGTASHHSNEVSDIGMLWFKKLLHFIEFIDDPRFLTFRVSLFN